MVITVMLFIENIEIGRQLNKEIQFKDLHFNDPISSQ